MSEEKFKIVKNGGVTTARGFLAAGVHAGFRRNPERADLALVVCEDALAQTCATFTQNKFAAAPVQFCKRQIGARGGDVGVCGIKAVAINSGNANAATGDAGRSVAEASAEIVAKELKCDRTEILVASTGVIGEQLPLEPFETGIPNCIANLSKYAGGDAARAIMTTDLTTKQFAIEISGEVLNLKEKTYHIGGMTKGSGMIQPNMATMIALVTTDIPLSAEAQSKAFRHAISKSFNCVTVDSDTSTNDSAFFMSSGKIYDNDEIEVGTSEYQTFEGLLKFVCIELAKMIAKDGEGATRIVQVCVEGAKNDSQAEDAARSVANSPLVKTAIAGRDANWGRVAAALGKSSAEFSQENVDIDFLKIPVLRSGLQVDFDEELALRKFENEQIDIDINLGEGAGHSVIWTCDLTHDYISINADYRS